MSTETTTNDITTDRFEAHREFFTARERAVRAYIRRHKVPHTAPILLVDEHPKSRRFWDWCLSDPFELTDPTRNISAFEASRTERLIPYLNDEPGRWSVLVVCGGFVLRLFVHLEQEK